MIPTNLVKHLNLTMFKVELPDPIAYHKYCMIHGRSGNLNLGSPCMVKGKCSKDFSEFVSTN